MRTLLVSLLALVVTPALAPAAGNPFDALEQRIAALEAENAGQQAQIDALLARLDAHEADASAHHAKTTSFAELTDAASDDQVPDDVTIDFAAAADTVDGMHASGLDQDARVADLEDLLLHFSRDGDEVTITGANLNVVNGAGATDTANGLGNVVIGYDEDTGWRGRPAERTGSHVLVVGRDHEYTSYGGIVGADRNTISGPFASVVGGSENAATGDWASVAGGYSNSATSWYSSVGGGGQNTAANAGTAVSGGLHNTASGSYSWIGGGQSNSATAHLATITGGHANTASGDASSVTGGYQNTASQVMASVGGGQGNTASGLFSAVGGGQGNTASLPYQFLP